MSASAISRLHAGHTPARRDSAIVLPLRLQRVLHEAVVTEQHLVGLATWLGVGPLLAAAAWLLFGGLAALGILTAVVSTPVIVLSRWRGRRSRLVVRALPDVLDTVSRSLRSGASFLQALRETAAEAPLVVAQELQTVLHAVGRGKPSRQALVEWAERVPGPEVRMVAAALAFASENEAGTTQALDGVGQSLRDGAALRGEIKALTAQASASMQALVLLPIGFVVLDLMGNKRTVTYLLTTDFGRLCLGLGVSLNVIGAVWMRTIIRRGAFG